MSLVKCPECGKEVSDKAKVCVQCGYPMEEMRQLEERKQGICYVNGKPYDLSEYLEIALKDSEKTISSEEVDRAIKQLEELTGMEDSAALYVLIYGDKRIPGQYDDASIQIARGTNIHTPKCPTCGSERIKELGFFERGAWGIKTFKCNNCAYEW